MATVDVKDLQTVGGDLVAKVGEELKRLLPTTEAANVEFTDKEGNPTDLATVIAEIITELESTATTANMNTAIKTAVDKAVADLVGGADESGDTLKELFDLIQNNKDVMSTLNQAIGGKVSKEEGKSLVADTLIAVLEKVTNQKIAAWDKAQANIVEEVKVNGVAQSVDGNKAVDLTVPVITVSATVPTDMKPGDMGFIIKS